MTLNLSTARQYQEPVKEVLGFWYWTSCQRDYDKQHPHAGVEVALKDAKWSVSLFGVKKENIQHSHIFQKYTMTFAHFRQPRGRTWRENSKCFSSILRWINEWICSERPITICAIVKTMLCQGSRIWPKRDVNRRLRPMRALLSLQRNLHTNMCRTRLSGYSPQQACSIDRLVSYPLFYSSNRGHLFLFI